MGLNVVAGQLKRRCLPSARNRPSATLLKRVTADGDCGDPAFPGANALRAVCAGRSAALR